MAAADQVVEFLQHQLRSGAIVEYDVEADSIVVDGRYIWQEVVMQLSQPDMTSGRAVELLIDALLEIDSAYVDTESL